MKKNHPLFLLQLLVWLSLLFPAVRTDAAGINMEKTVDDNYICAGDTVTYTLVTRLIGGDVGVQFRNLVVSDDLCTNIVFVGGDKNGNGLLDFGEEFTNQCSMVLMASTLNIARDRADVYDNGVYSGSVSNFDAVAVTVVNPALSVTPLPANQQVPAGSDVEIVYAVANTGDVDLEQIQLVHSSLGACNQTLPLLAVGETIFSTCMVNNVQQDLADTLLVTGVATGACSVAAEASSVVEVEQASGVVLNVSADPTACICPGGDAVFTLTTTNTGQVELVQLAITTPAGVCDRVVGTLAPGASTSVVCRVTVNDDFTLNAVVNGTDRIGNPVTDSGSAAVAVDTLAPSIPTLPPMRLAGDVDCQVQVPDFTGVTATDDCSSVVTVTQVPTAGTVYQGPGTFTVTLTATDDCGNFSTREVSVAVACDEPTITIEKTVSAGVNVGCPGSEKAVVLPSQLATYCFTVRNDGAVNLSDVVLTDDMLNMPPILIGNLAVNASVTTSVVARVDQSFVNVASVTGRGPGGEVVQDDDPAEVEVVRPGIHLEKSVYLGRDNGASCSNAVEFVSGFIGQDITYCFVVSNTGDTYLADIELDDPLLGITNADMTIQSGTAPLAPGEEMVLFYETFLTISTVNVATVTGNPSDPQGNDLAGIPDQTDSDDATVDAVPRPLGLLAGTVYFDQNDDGTQTVFDGEFGFTNVTVILYRDGLPFAAQRTDDDGDYSFPQLGAGTYFTVVTVGDIPSPFDLASNFAVTNNLGAPYVITADEEYPDVDFAFLKYGTISGYVWYDTNLDGRVDENLTNPRIGINTAVVNLYRVEGGAETLVDTRSTVVQPGGIGNLGYYLFDRLLIGDYRADVVDATVDTAFATLGISTDGRRPTTAMQMPLSIDPVICDRVMNFGFISNPTFITLASFSAVPVANGVQISWTTGTEIDNLGFHIYRSTRINGARTRVNRRMLAAENQATGASYSYVDARVPGGKYFYWLEDHDRNEGATVHGPAVVLVAANQVNVLGSATQFVEGFNQVTDEVLRAAGLNNYREVCVFVDGIEVPVLVADQSHIVFHVPAGTQSVSFGLSRYAKRMQDLDLSVE